MKDDRTSVTVMPSQYEIAIGISRWCKIAEVCDLVPELMKPYGVEISLTPEEFISNFASLTPYLSDRVTAVGEKPKKLFRYSLDGRALDGKYVPTEGKNVPPHKVFQLDGIDGGYPLDMFVQAPWVEQALMAVRKGAICAFEYEGSVYGQAPEGSNLNTKLIHVSGPKRES
jgi:hypothetical protein